MVLHSLRRLHYAVKRAWWKVGVDPLLRASGVEIAENVQIQGLPTVSMAKDSRIWIGARCVLCSDSGINALGINHPVVLRTLLPGAEIVIGADTGLSGGSICAATSVRIGVGCLIGANVTLADTDFHALAPHNRRYNRNPAEIAAAAIVIEDNVFLGAHVFVGKGVRIGRNSVIGAGSIVTRDIPANVVAAGNPAKVIRQLSQR